MWEDQDFLKDHVVFPIESCSFNMVLGLDFGARLDAEFKESHQWKEPFQQCVTPTFPATQSEISTL